MEKRKIKLIYELVISILSVIAVVFAIMDLTGHSSSSITIIDNVIWIIFVIDYITRFVVSNSKKYFVRNSSPIKAIIFVVFILVLQQIEGNLIYPKVVLRYSDY